MASPLLIGSGNLDKAAELRALLAGSSYDVKSLADFPAVAEPEETSDTFEGNGLLKARYYAEQFGLACVADDSGLEVDALGGEPGVYSARYAGEDCSYDDNNRKLLDALNDVPDEKRGARFVCCAVYVDGNGDYHAERGTVEGRIARAVAGRNGFGYDPVFVPTGHDTTFAEMGPAAKRAISHRGEAFRQMSAYLESRLVAT